MKNGLEQWELSPESKGWLWHTPLYETWVPERFERLRVCLAPGPNKGQKAKTHPFPHLVDSAIVSTIQSQGERKIETHPFCKPNSVITFPIGEITS